MTDKEGKIYEMYRDKVYSYMFTSIQNHHKAEDLCSDVFFKVYKKLETYDETKSSISTWIYNISKNTLYDYYRTNHPTSELSEDIVTFEDLDERVIYEDELKSLADALKKLDETQRKVIILRYYKNKTLQEIADELEISLFRVWSLHKKSLKEMKKIMQPEQNNEN